DEAILVAITLVIIWKLGVQLHPLVIITVVLLMGLVAFIVYRAIRSTTGTKAMGGKKSMLGLTGCTVTPLDPEGLVRAHGELWKAECTGDTIDSQEEIIVIGIQGLKLFVKRKDNSEQM
ncbi:NfeD family protein, partial [Chloroflexota bacterium]